MKVKFIPPSEFDASCVLGDGNAVVTPNFFARSAPVGMLLSYTERGVLLDRAVLSVDEGGMISLSHRPLEPRVPKADAEEVKA